MRLLSITNIDDDDVQILILFSEQRRQVLRLVIWTQDEDNPFHGANDPLVVDFSHLIFWLTLQSVDDVLQRMQSILHHLLVALLSVTDARTILLQILLIHVLQVIREVIHVDFFHRCVHLLLFENDDVLAVVAALLLVVC